MNKDKTIIGRIFFVLICFLFLTGKTNSQTLPDTTDWFPLQVGNIWQYVSSSGYSVREITGMMTHNNGKEYFKMKYWSEEYGELGYNLYREDELGNVYFSGHEGALEYKMFDFNVEDGSIWQIDTPFIPHFENFMGVLETWYDNNNILGISLPKKHIMYVNVDTTGEFPDTTWGAYVDLPSYMLCKGIGVVEPYVYVSEIIGAKLNGIVYGILTDTEKDETENELTREIRIEAFPNPFNPSTKIRVTLPESDKIVVKVYSTLGEEVRTVYKGELNAGPHVFPFSGTGLTSGVYFCTVTGNNFFKSMKLLLVK